MDEGMARTLARDLTSPSSLREERGIMECRGCWGRYPSAWYAGWSDLWTCLPQVVQNGPDELDVCRRSGHRMGLNAYPTELQARLVLVSLKNLPCATIILVVSTFVLTYCVWASGVVLPLPISRYDFVDLLHPLFLHQGYDILSETLLLLVAGTLIESWMMISRKWRIGILGLCYFVSLASITVEKYFLPQNQMPFLGPSRLISAALAFILIYYILFRKHIRFDWLGMFAPIGAGLLIWPLIDTFLRWFPQAIYLSTYQLPAFSFGLCLGYPLLKRLREDTPEHQKREA